MKFHYYLADDQLVIEDTDGSTQKWKGKPDDLTPSMVLEIPDLEDCIVLLKYWENGNRFNNLLRINSAGEVVWRAALPATRGVDAYVEASWQSDQLVGWTWSGFMETIDLDTGKILSGTFVG